MKEKKCSVCGLVKADSEYYHRKTGEILPSCKECKKASVRKWNKANADQHRKRVKAWKVENPVLRAAQYRRYRNRNEKKYAAHHILQTAVKASILVKPVKCQVCEKETEKNRLAGHHESYDKPLEVLWVCDPCHKRIHAKAKGE